MNRFRRLPPRGVVLIGALLAMFLGVGASPATAAPRAPACRLGLHFSQLYGVDPHDDTVHLIVLVWAHCAPTTTYDPLPGMVFPDAFMATRTEVLRPTLVDGVKASISIYSMRLRSDFDVKNYPFDRPKVVLRIHPAVTSREFSFTADIRYSSYNAYISELGLGEFRVERLGVGARPDVYDSGFGNPGRGAADRNTSYTTLIGELQLTRTSYTGVIPLIVPLYLSVFICFSVLLLISRSNDLILGRMDILGASLFTVAINMQVVRTTLGATGLGVVDQLHLLGLAAIMGGIAVTGLCWTLAVRRVHILRIRALNRILGATIVITYLLANILVVRHALAH